MFGIGDALGGLFGGGGGSALGGIASLLGAGGAAAGLFGGQGTGPAPTYGGQPSFYIPSGVSQADTAYQGALNTQVPYAQQLPGSVIPQSQQLYGNILNNPYAAQAQDYSTAAGGQAAQWGQVALPAAYQEVTAGQQMLPYAQSILGTAFDPQQALYNRTENQLTQEINAGLGASNQLGTPTGAGVLANALSNFNLDWQDRQLGRQTQGIQGAGSALSSGTGTIGQGVGLAQRGIGLTQEAGQLPYQTYLGQQQPGLQAAGQINQIYGGALAPSTTVMAGALPYMQFANQGVGQAYTAGADLFGQNQILGNQLGQSLAGLGNTNFFGPSTSSVPTYPGYSGAGSQLYGTTDLGGLTGDTAGGYY